MPLGIVVLPTLSREAAVGREAAFASLLTRALRLLIYVMVPIAVLTAVVRQPVVDALFGGGSIRQSDLDLIAITLVGFVDRPDRARPHRRPGEGVLRAAGHGHAGRRGGRRRGRQLHARGRPGRAAGPARDRRSPSRSPPGSRPSPCWRSSTDGCRTSSSAASAGSASRRSSAASWPGWRRRSSWPARRRARRRSRGGSCSIDRRRSSASPSGRSTRASRSPCGSRNCRLSSGSWPTCCAARSGRDGRRPIGWDRFVEASDPGSYLQTIAWARVKAVNGWTAHTIETAPGPSASAPRSSSGGRDRCRGASPTRRAARSPVPGTPRRSVPSPRRSGATSRRSAGRVSHVRIDPEIEENGPLDPDGALREALRSRRLASGTADPAERDPDHRPPAGRGRAARRPAQEVAPVRQQGTDGGRDGRRCGRRPARRVLPDLPRDGGPRGLPHPRRIGLSRRVGGLRPVGQRPAALRPDARRRRRRRPCSSCAAARGWSSRTAA